MKKLLTVIALFSLFSLASCKGETLDTENVVSEDNMEVSIEAVTATDTTEVEVSEMDTPAELVDVQAVEETAIQTENTSEVQ